MLLEEGLWAASMDLLLSVCTRLARGETIRSSPAQGGSVFLFSLSAAYARMRHHAAPEGVNELISFLVEPLEPRQFLSTYFVSPGGNDGHSGEAPTAAWRSIDRVNKQQLKPGDLVLFQAGQTFHGSIYIPSTEGGTLDKPV